MSIKNNKGITLIALVITIIVLLILAGVTISMVLGDDGIIQNAQQAKKQNEDASLKDAISVAKADAATYKYVEQTAMEEAKLEENGFTFPADYEYNGSVAKVVEGVPIPVGFAYVQGTKVDTGLIVVDGYGNEYVWVPVDGENVQLELDDTYGSIGTEPSAEGLDSTKVGDMTQEYTDMETSVEIYGGFYVGRYETSWTGNRVASVPNVTSMSGSTQVDGSGANWYTFYNKQKELYGENASVTSGMIYGSQWDAIMLWMKDVPNVTDSSKKYIKDSTDMGNYGELCPSCNGDCCDDCGWMGVIGTPIETGSNSEYSVKNIFDLAGNYFEWSQEAIGSLYRRVSRGGYYGGNGSGRPASNRHNSGPGDALGAFSSRLQLYIK